MGALGEVAIVATGVANIASVAACFCRLGVRARLTRDPNEIVSARALVLPGVGSFDAGMAALRAARLVAPVRSCVQRGAPTLAICLGMQMLCEESDEAPGVAGVGAIPGALTRFPAAVCTPLIGWRRIELEDDERETGDMRRGDAYFSHSYRLAQAPSGWRAAWASHGGRFVAALEREAVLACQFHPELSSKYGQNLVGRWLQRAGYQQEAAT